MTPDHFPPAVANARPAGARCERLRSRGALAALCLSGGLALCAASSASLAQPAEPQKAARAESAEPRLSLSASASREVTQDSVTVSMYVEREAADPAQAQAQVNAALAPVLAQLKSEHRDLEVASGAFRTWPVYRTESGASRIAGWRSRGALQISGKPSDAFNRLVGQLAGRLNIESVAYFLSRDARLAAEQSLIDEAVRAFRAKAQSAASSLGFKGYSIRQVQLGGGGGDEPVPMPRMMASRAAADSAPVPLAGAEGKTTVTVTVSGTVRLEP